MKNPWRKKTSSVLYKNKYGYTLREDKVVTPAGTDGSYMVFESKGFVSIVATTIDNKIIMVKQWRYPIEKESIEIPAGTIEDDTDPLETAKRELLEEVGGISEHWQKLTSYWIGNGALRIQGHLFWAKNVSIGKSSQEDTEKISTILKDFGVVNEMILNGEIDDERTIIGVLMLKNFIGK